ncbi:non-specific lipid transfer protein GPI-anchored 10-like [Zingiber officinale]|uniref:non-specific lipid transfer protein GPI-anchored 10-like n=1 Tax=Zingiber officinale TaxID=94328 RepID=UPI001C4A96E9|nr:non-specific lipid transfer protein GPI-anchored 10-like [Zingiber officinale]
MKATRSAAVAMFLALLMAASPLLNSGAAPLPGAAKCGGRLLLLLPCMAFVEGNAGDPTDACCDNLVNLYRDDPDCLCPLLAVALAMPPVNRTLTLQLPVLCRLNLTAGSCSGTC